MRVCIILNGEVKDYDYIKKVIATEKYDYLICADGGANHMYKMNLIPDYIIGDLDSLDKEIKEYYRQLNVKFKKFPTKKDETDTELCIYLAKKLGASKVDFYASLGGRIDHTIANINLLYYLKKINIIPRIISEKEDIYIAKDEEIIIWGNRGDTISVIPIKDNAKGVTLKGLEYPLNDYFMKYGVPIGMSNVMLSNECSIQVEKGNLLVIKNK